MRFTVTVWFIVRVWANDVMVVVKVTKDRGQLVDYFDDSLSKDMTFTMPRVCDSIVSLSVDKEVSREVTSRLVTLDALWIES